MEQDHTFPLVSIVISVYRRDLYLPHAIHSSLNQTWPEVEILVAEDGGSDCAAAIVASFAQPPSRLRLIRQQTNIGAAANKLHAWQAAKGDFIVNLDDDDLLEPEFIAKLLPPLLHDKSVVLSFCDHYLVNQSGEIEWAETEKNTSVWKRQVLEPGHHYPLQEIGLVNQSIPFAMGTLWSRSRLKLDDFRTESGPSYDLFMTYVATKSGRGAFYVNERLVKYRVHPGMETCMGRERIYRANIFCNRTFLRDHDLSEWRSVFRGRLKEAYAGLGVVTLRQKRRGTAMKNFLNSLLVKPSKRAVVGLLYCLHPKGPGRVY